MRRLIVTSLFVLLSSVFVFAQTTTGRLAGTVNGPDGVLPGAIITVTDNKTNKEFTATSNESGNFVFPQLEFGTYTVKVTATGFKTFVANDVKIDVGRDYTLNPNLEIGDVQETVTVTAGADVVTANSAQISNTVSPQQILSLPLVARNPLALATLQPGVQSNPFQGTTINGMRTSMTNITRDGINIQDAYIRTNATDFAPGRPTVDDTAEFTISTSNQEADQGYGGSQIRLVTPRGTKDFSGTLYAYNRNSEFAANNFFSNRSGLVRPFRNRNNFGGKLGGPVPLLNIGNGGPRILKDKGFFFVNYDKLIDPLSTRYNRTILTPTARAGEFRYNRTTFGSDASGDPIDVMVGNSRVVCPARRSQAEVSVCSVSNILSFAAGRNLPNIPSTINPIIQQRILSQIPTESNATGGDGRNTAGYTLNRQTNQERTTFTTRFDLDFNDRNTFNLVYSWNLESNLRGDTDSTGFSNTPRYTQTSENRTLSMAYRAVITPNIVNELRGGGFFSNVPWFLNSAASGFPEYLLAIPLITNPELPNSIQGRNTGNKTIMDNVDWIIGRHNLRFGGQYQRFRVDAYDEFGTIPTYTISTGTATPQFVCPNIQNCNFPGGISSTELGTANGLLALLGGIVSAGTQTYNLESIESGYKPIRFNQPFRYSNHSAYISDRWLATNNLTITGGVRYEVYPAMRLANGLGLEVAIADPDNPLQSILAQNGTYRLIGGNSGVDRTFYKTDYNNFAPQIGFAWAPKFENGFGRFILGENFVVRGGYSQAYSMESILRALDNAYTSNQGLGGTVGRALDPVTGNINLNLRLGTSNLPPTVAPALALPPRSFIQNNSPPITNFFGTVWAIDPKLQIPKVEQYSVGIQREFFGNMALEVRYVGTRSNSLIRGIDYNQVDIFNNGFLSDFERARANLALTGNPFCTTAGCQTLSIFRESASGPGRLGVAPTTTSTPAGTLQRATFINQLNAGTPAQLAALFINSAGNLNNHPSVNNPNAVPFINLVANPATGVVDLLTNAGMYYYNSLQLEVRRRFAQGLYFQANYTYSKNITNAIGTGQTLFEPFLDINNQDLDRQRADYDQTHVFNFNGVYQLPFGKGRMFLNRGGIVNALFGGWEISGLVNWASGAPITFIDPRGTLNRDARSGRQTANSNLTADQIRSLMGIFEQNGRIYWINPSIINPSTGRASNGFGQAAFDGQVFFNVEPGKTGNLARTIVNGPVFFNTNAALMKNFIFTENGMRLQLRMEAFNVFNNVNFFNNTQFADINSPTFGQVTSAGAARTIQFAARFEF
jgi:hypothetical protein